MKSNLPKSLAIIAGSGELPKRVVDACEAAGCPYIIILLDASLSEKYKSSAHCYSIPMTSVGKILSTIRKANIDDILITGYITRPDVSLLSVDLKGILLLKDLMMLRQKGDDAMLRAVCIFLEKEGFSVRGVHDVLPELLMPATTLTTEGFDAKEQADIALGLDVLSALGGYDVGQSIIVHDGRVLGIEAAEGTDALIARCASLQKKEGGAVLVKALKHKQDLRVDFPCVGLDTLCHLKDAGMRGLAIPKGGAILIDKPAMIDFANEHRLVLAGAGHYE